MLDNTIVSDKEKLFLHRKVWNEKPSLQYFYTEAIFKQIETLCDSFPVLEVGSGPGFLKEYLRKVVASDIVPMPWLDLACQSDRLPFKDSTFSSIVCVDVFHHLISPLGFLKEAQRVTCPKGRIIMVEPWITPFSIFFLKAVHHELCEKVKDPWEGAFKQNKRHLEGNMYIPYQCFEDNAKKRFQELFPHLKLESIKLLGVFVYILTGGFQPGIGIKSQRIIKRLLKVESLLEPVLSWLFAMRALIVIENLK